MTDPRTDPLRKAILALRAARERIEELERAADEPIAVVGIGCRFPGGGSGPEAFWDLLRGGVDAVGEVPADRWDVDAWYDPDPDAPGKTDVRFGAFLPGIDLFDPEHFGIAPREAAAMDPQQRLLLEVAWEALEDAGIAPDGLAGSATGVFLGINGSDYHQMSMEDPEAIDAYAISGSVASVAAGRLSYVLGLQGPAVALDTACSSSLVAVHLACQSLRSRDSRVALAGGVSVMLLPKLSVGLSKLHMMAPDGRCKTFDEAADGFVQGEGCGLVVLKRLADARADGDRVLALLRASAVNQDGRSGGLTAPSLAAQRSVVREALERAGVTPSSVGYVEAHGTGTALGDPIEVHALAEVLGEGRDRPLVVGSVKTNIGHLGPAAGIAGLIKAVLALRHREIPPHLHFRKLNPHIGVGAFPLVIPTAPTPFEPIGGRRLAGVSSFGFSGTNVHVVLEEAPEGGEEGAAGAGPSPLPEREAHVLCLSASGPEALEELSMRTAAALGRLPGSFADACFTAATGRARLAHRRAVVAKGAREAVERLGRASMKPALAKEGRSGGHDAPRIGFLFTGEGPLRAGAGRALYASEPSFAAAVDRCSSLLGDRYGSPLASILFDGEVVTALEDPGAEQVGLFVLEYALATMLAGWNVLPAAVLGHSLGEVAAAVVAGALDPGEALELVATRGLHASRLPELSRAAAGTRPRTPRPPRIPLVSSLTGDLVSSIDGATWARPARGTVRFSEGVDRLAALGCDLLLEVGPRPVPGGLARQGRPGLPTLSLLRGDAGDGTCVAEALAALWERGVDVDWGAVHRGRGRRKVTLPTYPFQRRRLWRESRGGGAETGWPPAARFPGNRTDVATGATLFDLPVGLEAFPFLSDHRIHGAAVVPGAFHLVAMATAMAAARETVTATADSGAAGDGGTTLLDVSFPRPLVLEEGRTVTFQTVLLPGDEIRTFSRAGDADWTEHASARLAPPPALPASLPGASPATPSRGAGAGGPGRLDGEAWAGQLARRDIAIGPWFRGIEEMVTGDGEAVASVRLPRPSGRGALPREDWGETLHPALLDACLQVAGGAAGEGEDGVTLLPVGIDRVTLGSGVATVSRVVARRRPGGEGGSFSTDLWLLDGAGKVVGEVEGLAARRADRGAFARAFARATAEPTYRVDWIARPFTGAGPDGSLRLGEADDSLRLVVADDERLAVALGDRLGGRVAVALPGEQLAEEGPDRFRIDRGDGAGLRALLARLPGLRDVVFSCGPDPAGGTAASGAEKRRGDPWSEQRLLSGGLLALAQALSEREAPPRLWVQTRDLLEGMRPAAGTLWGLAATVALEMPGLASTLVDLDGDERSVAALAAEVRAGGPEDRLRFRAGERLVARLRRVPSAAGEAPVLRETTLVAGGLGGLGLQVARWAVARGARDLVLAGRRPPSPEASAAVAELRDLGARVTVVRCDVAEREQVARLFDSLAGLPPVRTIVHAAGVASEGTLAGLDWEGLARSLAAKVAGAWWLHEQSLSFPLDRFVLFSSIASLLGGAGQSGYAGANSFLDALARHRRAAGLPAVSILWGRWAGVGMAASLDEPSRRRVDRLGVVPMEPSSCLTALDAALAGPLTDPFVARVDWARFLSARAGIPLLLADLAADLPGASTSLSAGSGDVRASILSASPDRRALLVEEELSRMVRRVLGIEEGRPLDPRRPLTQAGLDSLMAVELRNRIRSGLGAAVTVATLLQGASLSDLVDTACGSLRPAGEWEELSI